MSFRGLDDVLGLDDTPFRTTDDLTPSYLFLIPYIECILSLFRKNIFKVWTILIVWSPVAFWRFVNSGPTSRNSTGREAIWAVSCFGLHSHVSVHVCSFGFRICFCRQMLISSETAFFFVSLYWGKPPPPLTAHLCGF